MESRKRVLMKLVAGKKIETDKENSLGDTGKENGTNGKSSIHIYTLSCVKWIAGKKFLYNKGSLAHHSLMT